MTSTRLSRAGALGLLLTVAGSAGVGPASAAPAVPTALADPRRAPVQEAVVACVGPSDVLEFGGAHVQLRLDPGRLAKDEGFVLVPVDDVSGLDAGPRTSLERRQRSATVVVAADGTALTRAATVEVRLGGQVVQRIPVAAGCGVVDPAPQRGPVIGQISSTTAAVTVAVENGSSVDDTIGVTLFPVGGTVGDSAFLALAPGTTGSVTFSSVAAGQYVVEAYGYTTFRTSTSAPFVVG